MQAERPHKHTHSPTTQPAVEGCSRNPSPNTHTHGAHPGQEWRGAGGAPTRAHTQPNILARGGGAQPKPKPKHTHTLRAPQPGSAGCKLSAHTSTHTPQHPSQEWRGAAETRAQTHTHPPHTPTRSGGVQVERADKHKRTPTPKPEPKHTHPRRTPQPGGAGYKQSTHTNTHTPQHPSQEWRGAAETPAEAHTPTPHTPARSGGVQAERAHKQTQNVTPQPGVALRSRNPNPTGTPTPHTPARSGRVQAERTHKRTHTPTPQPGLAGRSRNPNRAISRPKHKRHASVGNPDLPRPQPGLSGLPRNPDPNTSAKQ